ncbi:MAG: GGDEF domain-containing protein [Parcubacteria group bacterium]
MLINILLFFVILLMFVSLFLTRKCNNLSQLAFRDPLTGLHNPHYLRVAIEKFISRARKDKLYICGFFIDLDDLKKINDNYSHAAGDMALRRVAEELKHAFSTKNDLLIRRYRGDEFIVLSLIKSRRVADMLFKSLSEKLSNLSIDYAGDDIAISASTGRYYLESNEADVISKILEKADEEMFISKRSKKAGA